MSGECLDSVQNVELFTSTTATERFLSYDRNDEYRVAYPNFPCWVRELLKPDQE